MTFKRAFSNFAELLRAGERANWGYHATLTYECAQRFREVRPRCPGGGNPVHAQGTYAQGRCRYSRRRFR